MKFLKTRVPHIILFLFAAAMLIITYLSMDKRENTDSFIKLSTGWTVKVNNDIYENVDLDEFRFPVTNKGDWIVVAGVLPEDFPGNQTMRIHMIHSYTRVYIDGEELFSYGKEEYEAGKMLGYGTRFLSIPENSQGKTLMITMFVTEDKAFSSIAPPEFYDEAADLSTFYEQRNIPMLVSITLIVVGFCISLVTFLLYFKAYSMDRLFCIGIFSLCIGLWSLCSYCLDSLVTSSLTVKVYMEYLSLYLAPFPILLYFREDVEARKKRWESFTFYALIIIEIQMFLLTVICQLTNTVHMSEFSGLFRAFMGVCAVFVLFLVIQDMRSERSHKLLVAGFVLLLVVAVRDLVAFGLSQYGVTKGAEGEYKSFISVGALVFVVAMLVDFIHEMRLRLFRTAETQFLEKIAYEDVLTGLSTRRKCEEIFDSIDSNGYDYLIIQFDLNNLKNTNDDYGHEAGDDLIVRFSKILKETFCDGEILGRMGGDEFIVIVTDAYGYKAEEKIAHMNELMEKDNEDKEIKVSASNGYCSSSEVKFPTARAVYKEADKRMYKDKEDYYKRTGKGRRRNDTQRID